MIKSIYFQILYFVVILVYIILSFTLNNIDAFITFILTLFISIEVIIRLKLYGWRSFNKRDVYYQ